MTKALPFVIAALFAFSTPVLADDTEAEPVAELQVLAADSVDLNDFLWVSRPVIVFADSPADPRLAEQLELLSARPDPLLNRDVIVIVDTNPDRDTRSDIRTQLRPRGFMLVIMGKDGEVELRKPAPWNVREITRTIDKMPLRQQEIRAGG